MDKKYVIVYTCSTESYSDRYFYNETGFSMEYKCAFILTLKEAMEVFSKNADKVNENWSLALEMVKE